MMKKTRMMVVMLVALMVMNVFGAVLPAGTGPAAAKAHAAQVKTTTGEISKEKAKRIAIENARENYGINELTIRDLEIEKDTYKKNKTWEVSFEAKLDNGTQYYEFDYELARESGKILHQEKELD